jgi:hypothetical protein
MHRQGSVNLNRTKGYESSLPWYSFLNMSEIVDVGVAATDQEMPNLKKNPSISGRHVLYGFFYQETPSLSDVT